MRTSSEKSIPDQRWEKADEEKERGSFKHDDSGHFHGLDHEEENLDILTGIPPQLEDEMPEPPNGGFIAWMQVLASLFANFNSWGIINAFGTYQHYYQNDLLSDRSPFQISWIVSLSGALAYFATNFFGALIDMGYIKIMALCASLGQFAALMLLSWSKTYAEVILTQGLFVGCVSALFYLISISCVAPYFTTKRPFAIGIGASGSSWGGTVYSVMAQKLMTEVGFGWSTRIIAFVQLALSLVTFLSIRRILPPTKRKSFVAVECFTEPATMLYCLGNAFGFLSLYTAYVYFQSYAIDTDTSAGKPVSNVYNYMTALVNAGSVLGRIIPSLIATKVGPFNVLIAAELTSMIISFSWIKAETMGGIVPVVVLYGFTSGPLMALPGAVVSALTKDFNRLGIRLSFALTSMSVGLILGPPLGGIIQRQYGWFWLKMYVGLSWVCCLICHTMARIVIGGFRLKAVA